MCTEDYYDALYHAYSKAYEYRAEEVNIFYFMLGILNIKNSPVTLVLNKYGITYEWLDAFVCNKYDVNLKNILVYNGKQLPHSNVVEIVLKNAQKLASIEKNSLDLIHVIIHILEIPSQFLVLLKTTLSFYNFDSLYCEMKQMIRKKSDKFVNEVIIE